MTKEQLKLIKELQQLRNKINELQNEYDKISLELYETIKVKEKKYGNDNRRNKTT